MLLRNIDIANSTYHKDVDQVVFPRLVVGFVLYYGIIN